MKKLAGVLVTIAVIAVGAGFASASGSTGTKVHGANLTKVKLVLNFAPGGYYANLAAGKARGFFRKQGLDVSFIVPATGADPAKLVANGAADLGFVHSTDVLLARAQGLPLVSVGTTHQYGTLEVLCPASKHVRKLTDLYGKTYGLTGIPADRVMFEQMLKLNHIDASKVHIVVAGFAGVPQLLAGRIDCYEGISWYEPILYNIALKKPAGDPSTTTALLYYKHGIPRFYTFGIVTSKSFLSQHAAVVKRFMAAWVKATQWSIAHPGPATADLLKAYPTLDKTSSLAIWKASAKVMTSTETKAHCLGWQSPAVFSGLEKFLFANKLISKHVAVSTAMTDAVLPCK
jgi:putative hydroxymethylpyrimidine transport system substrate-binding protein